MRSGRRASLDRRTGGGRIAEVAARVARDRSFRRPLQAYYSGFRLLRSYLSQPRACLSSSSNQDLGEGTPIPRGRGPEGPSSTLPLPDLSIGCQVTRNFFLSPILQAAVRVSGKPPRTTPSNSRPTGIDARPNTKGAENVIPPMLFPILASDFEGAHKSEEMEAVMVPM